MLFNLKGITYFSLLLTLWSSPIAQGAYIQTRNTTTSSNTTADPEYDYIVVGSGPGGGPLAARLAQAGFSVLLIDAGEDHTEDTVVQFFVNHYQDRVMAEQDSKFTYRMPDGRFWVGANPPAGSKPLGIFYPRTGTLGGCAEHNAMILIYPAESDWNNIANITGDASWSAENMRQYFVKSENNQYLSPTAENRATHGFNGWLDSTVSDARTLFDDPTVVGMLQGSATALGQANATASFFKKDLTIAGNLAKVAGLDLNADTNTRDMTSAIYQIPLSITNATRARSSHRSLMLDTASTKASKLHIQLNTLVTKVLFDRSGSTPRAIGVEYQTGKHLYRADPNAASGAVTGSGSFFAKREVVISGGTFNTPQILKLSGIGSSAERMAHNIPVILDAPAVGTNMQDRYEVGIVTSTSVDFIVWKGCTFLNTDDACFDQWSDNTTDRGIYGGNTFAYALTQSSTVADPSAADLITGAIPATFTGYYPGWSKRTAVDAHHWTWLILKAHSRNNAGTITLSSNDPRDMPQINFNSYAVGGDADLQATYEGILLARKMIAAAQLFVGTITEELPGPDIQTEAEIKQWIRQEAWGHHASCSVPIGADDDKNAVLDSKFRVKGVKGLRVVDASVFPKIPSFYIVSAVYMISEKAADVIIQDARGH